MERQKKIADASVVAKLFMNEKGSTMAERLIQAHSRNKILVIVPELIFLEVLNALRYKHKDLKILKDSAKQLGELGLHVELLTPFLMQKAAALALEYDLSMYDATYAALAQIHGCSLVTADKALLKIPNAEHLEKPTSMFGYYAGKGWKQHDKEYDKER